MKKEKVDLVDTCWFTSSLYEFLVINNAHQSR